LLITLTRGVVAPAQREQVESFLREFLPRLKREQPGALDAFHFHNEATNESTTIILWRDEKARADYREGALIKEAMAMEQRLGLTTSRDAYPVSISTRDES